MDELTSLARAAGRGDRAALARLVRETQSDVWRLCAHLVDPGSADDLTQDTYLRAIPALGKFRADAPVRTWLLAIARRACAAEISARTRGRQLTARLAGTPHGTLPTASVQPGVQAEADELLGALEPNRRRVRPDPVARLLLRRGRGRLRRPRRHDPVPRRAGAGGPGRHDGGPGCGRAPSPGQRRLHLNGGSPWIPLPGIQFSAKPMIKFPARRARIPGAPRRRAFLPRLPPRPWPRGCLPVRLPAAGSQSASPWSS
jgi:RNA polymerase sigma-70 factor, ECF subfamily